MVFLVLMYMYLLNEQRVFSQTQDETTKPIAQFSHFHTEINPGVMTSASTVSAILDEKAVFPRLLSCSWDPACLGVRVYNGTVRSTSQTISFTGFMAGSAQNRSETTWMVFAKSDWKETLRTDYPCNETIVPPYETSLGRSCYVLGEASVDNVDAAVAYCGKLGMSLSSLETEAEYDSVHASLLANHRIWIDLHRAGTNFVWGSDGSRIAYDKWGRDDPNGLLANEDCAMIFENQAINYSGMVDCHCVSFLWTGQPLCENFTPNSIF